ncbi:MAG: hypothetical protein AAGJ46_07965 [Planctomycetota bacterium]
MPDHTRLRRKAKQEWDPAQYNMPYGQGADGDSGDWTSVRDRWRKNLIAMPAHRSGLSPRRWRNVVDFLRAVLWIDGNGDGCWASVETLAYEARLSPATLRRAKKDALSLGLVAVTAQRNKSGNGGRANDLVRVNIGAVARLGADRSGAEVSAQTRGLTAHSDRVTAHLETVSAQSERYTRLSNTPKEYSNHNRDDWAEVVVELERAGVNQARPACESAADAGVSQAEVRALIAYWWPRRDAWAPYSEHTLYRQVCRCLPGQPPFADWPPYAEGASTLRARKRDEAEGAARAKRARGLREKWQPLAAVLSDAQGRAIGQALRTAKPFFAQPSIDEQQLRRDGIYPMLDELGSDGIAQLLAAADCPLSDQQRAAARPPPAGACDAFGYTPTTVRPSIDE